MWCRIAYDRNNYATYRKKCANLIQSINTDVKQKRCFSEVEYCWAYVCGASSSAGLGNRSYSCAVMSSGRNASAYLHPICLQMLSIGLDNHYFFLFFYLSLHISYSSFHPYFTSFLFPSFLLLVPLSSHPLLISSLVFLPLSANTCLFRCLLYSTRNPIHTVNQ
jgi:hypothetical protein